MVVAAASLITGCRPDEAPDNGPIQSFSYCSGAVFTHDDDLGTQYGVFSHDETTLLRVIDYPDVDVLVDVDPEVLDEVDRTIRTHEMHRWDGFDESDGSAEDGSWWSVNVSYENGSLTARGTNAEPDGFDEAISTITDHLDEASEHGETSDVSQPEIDCGQ